MITKRYLQIKKCSKSFMKKTIKNIIDQRAKTINKNLKEL